MTTPRHGAKPLAQRKHHHHQQQQQQQRHDTQLKPSASRNCEELSDQHDHIGAYHKNHIIPQNDNDDDDDDIFTDNGDGDDDDDDLDDDSDEVMDLELHPQLGMSLYNNEDFYEVVADFNDDDYHLLDEVMGNNQIVKDKIKAYKKKKYELDLQNSTIDWKRWCKYLLFTVLFITVAVIVWIYFRKLKTLVRTLLKHRHAGYIILWLGFVGQSLLGLPTLPLTLAAGYTYGTMFGTFIITICSLSGVTIGFLISRYLLRAYFRKNLLGIDDEKHQKRDKLRAYMKKKRLQYYKSQHLSTPMIPQQQQHHQQQQQPQPQLLIHQQQQHHHQQQQLNNSNNNNNNMTMKHLHSPEMSELDDDVSEGDCMLSQPTYLPATTATSPKNLTTNNSLYAPLPSDDEMNTLSLQFAHSAHDEDLPFNLQHSTGYGGFDNTTYTTTTTTTPIGLLNNQLSDNDSENQHPQQQQQQQQQQYKYLSNGIKSASKACETSCDDTTIIHHHTNHGGAHIAMNNKSKKNINNNHHNDNFLSPRKNTHKRPSSRRDTGVNVVITDDGSTSENDDDNTGSAKDRDEDEDGGEEEVKKPNFFQQIDNVIADDGFTLVFLLRFSPLHPYGVFNYLFGLTSVKFVHYWWACFISMFPTTLMEVYLGSALKNVKEIIGVSKKNRPSIVSPHEPVKPDDIALIDNILKPNDGKTNIHDNENVFSGGGDKPADGAQPIDKGGDNANKNNNNKDKNGATPTTPPIDPSKPHSGGGGLFPNLPSLPPLTDDLEDDDYADIDPNNLRNHNFNNNLSDEMHDEIKSSRETVVFWAGLLFTLTSAALLTVYIKRKLSQRMDQLQQQQDDLRLKKRNKKKRFQQYRRNQEEKRRNQQQQQHHHHHPSQYDNHHVMTAHTAASTPALHEMTPAKHHHTFTPKQHHSTPLHPSSTIQHHSSELNVFHFDDEQE